MKVLQWEKTTMLALTAALKQMKRTPVRTVLYIFTVKSFQRSMQNMLNKWY